MRPWLVLLTSFVASFILALAFRLLIINKNSEKAQTLTSTICDIIQIRAQGGSTRDVYDQVYAFIKKHSPDPVNTIVELKFSGKSLGPTSNVTENTHLKLSCHIDSINDYELSIFFPVQRIFNFDFFIFWSKIFLGILIFIYFHWRLFRFLKEFWSNELLQSIRSELGLERDSNPSVRSGLNAMISKLLGRVLVLPLKSVKTGVIALKNSLEAKQKELQTSQIAIEEFQKESEKAKAFEEKVRMARHDLRAPLSIIKLAKHNQSSPEDFLPGLIYNVEKILNDLDEPPSTLSQLSFESDSSMDLLESLTRQALKSQSLMIKSKSNIKLIYNESSDYLTPVKVIPSLWSRIVANLLLNAIEATDSSDGTIEITIRKNDSWAILEINDNGPGISPSIMPHLFESGATFGKANGNGFGLHFVKSTIESWGGQVEVESNPRSGAKFILKLPLIESLDKIYVTSNQVSQEQGLVWIDDTMSEQWELWGKSEQNVMAFSTPQDFMQWWNNGGDKSLSSIIIDYHLDEHITGVDVIRSIDRKSNVFICTSDYLNKDCVESAIQLGLKIIPKHILHDKVSPRF